MSSDGVWYFQIISSSCYSVITIIPHSNDYSPSNDELISEEQRDVTIKTSTNDDGVGNELKNKSVHVIYL